MSNNISTNVIFGIFAYSISRGIVFDSNHPNLKSMKFKNTFAFVLEESKEHSHAAHLFKFELHDCSSISRFRN